MGVDQLGVDQLGIDEMGVDQLGVDEMGVDQMGRYQIQIKYHDDTFFIVCIVYMHVVFWFCFKD